MSKFFLQHCLSIFSLQRNYFNGSLKLLSNLLSCKIYLNLSVKSFFSYVNIHMYDNDMLISLSTVILTYPVKARYEDYHKSCVKLGSSSYAFIIDRPGIKKMEVT